MCKKTLQKILKKETFNYKERCDKRRGKYKVGIQKRGWRKWQVIKKIKNEINSSEYSCKTN